MAPPSRRGDPGFGGLPLLHRKTRQRRPHPSPQSNGCAAHHANPAAARRGAVLRAAGLAPPRIRDLRRSRAPIRPGHATPEGHPDLTPHGPGDSRSTGPGCPRCQGPTGRRTRGRDRTDHGPAAQPGGSHAHHHPTRTTTRAGSATRPGRHRVPVRGRVPHHRSTSAGRRRHRPQHPRRPATPGRHADLLRPDRGRRRRHHRLHPARAPSPGTAAPSPNCSPTSTPAPRTAPSTPDPWSASPPRAPRTGGGERHVPDPGQRRRHPPPHRPHRHRCPRVHVHQPPRGASLDQPRSPVTRPDHHPPPPRIPTTPR